MQRNSGELTEMIAPPVPEELFRVWLQRELVTYQVKQLFPDLAQVGVEKSKECQGVLTTGLANKPEEQSMVVDPVVLKGTSAICGKISQLGRTSPVHSLSSTLSHSSDSMTSESTGSTCSFPDLSSTSDLVGCLEFDVGAVFGSQAQSKELCIQDSSSSKCFRKEVPSFIEEEMKKFPVTGGFSHTEMMLLLLFGYELFFEEKVYSVLKQSLRTARGRGSIRRKIEKIVAQECGRTGHFGGLLKFHRRVVVKKLLKRKLLKVIQDNKVNGSAALKTFTHQLCEYIAANNLLEESA